MTDRATIEIETFTLGPYETNCYLVRTTGEDGSPACWIADVGFEPAAMLERVASLGLTPEAFVLTHAHVDHIAGLREAKGAFPDTPILVHAREADRLTDPKGNLSGFGPQPVTAPPADRELSDGDSTLELNGQAWRVMQTPGHSPGSVSLYHAGAGVCLCGDAIFNGSIGRTDFPGCSFEVLAASIRREIYALPDETRLLPGHGPETTVGHEKRTNPFVPGV